MPRFCAGAIVRYRPLYAGDRDRAGKRPQGDSESGVPMTTYE